METLRSGMVARSELVGPVDQVVTSDGRVYQDSQLVKTAPIPSNHLASRTTIQGLDHKVLTATALQQNDCYWHTDAWPFEGWDSIEEEPSPPTLLHHSTSCWLDWLVNWLVKLRG